MAKNRVNMSWYDVPGKKLLKLEPTVSWEFFLIISFTKLNFTRDRPKSSILTISCHFFEDVGSDFGNL